MRTVGLLAAGIALALSAPACGDEEPTAAGPGGGGDGGAPPVRACTEIGCASGLYLDVRAVRRELPGAERLRVCLATRCREFDLDRTDLVSMGLRGLRDRRQVAVRMVVLGAEGEALARRRAMAPIRRSRPNGPGCPPVCFQVGVRLEREGLRLVPTG